MSFPPKHLIQYQPITNYNPKHNPKQTKKHMIRKEQDLHLAFPFTGNKGTFLVGRASASTSASITVEAALAVPFFFLVMICLVYLMEIMAIQVSVKEGLYYAAERQAQQMYPVGLLSSANMTQDLVGAVGSERLDRSLVVGGSRGIDCSASRFASGEEVLYAQVNYRIKIPAVIFQLGEITYQEEVKVKPWMGYKKAGFSKGKEDMVYMTENGLVYHKDDKCTYLDLSIQLVPLTGIENLRNQDQGKYYPCERCRGSNLKGAVYITDTGNRYHQAIGCSGLKRSVYSLPLADAKGKRGCSRCVN